MSPEFMELFPDPNAFGYCRAMATNQGKERVPTGNLFSSEGYGDGAIGTSSSSELLFVGQDGDSARRTARGKGGIK